MDTVFLATEAGADLRVTAIATLADGRILIAGGFFIFNGTYRNHIARLWSERPGAR